MANMTNYLEKKLLDHAMGKAAYTMPAAIYLGLFTSATDEAGGGTEVSGGDYERIELTSILSATDSVSGTSANLSAISFGPATADWGMITHVGVFDAATGGNMLFHGEAPEGKLIPSGDSAQFGAGSFSIEFR